MTAQFIYALPVLTSPQQAATVARGLRAAFPDVELSAQQGGPIAGSIIPIAGRSSQRHPEEIIMNPPPAALVHDVRADFAGLLVEAAAGPRAD